MLLIGRLIVLQVMRYDYYAELSQGNRVRVEPLPAQRGLILDRNGAVLAENHPAFQLELVRERVPDVDATLARLIEIGVLPADDLAETAQARAFASQLRERARSACASPKRKSRASRYIVSNSRAWTSPPASRASIHTANMPCTRSATSPRSAKTTSSASRRKTQLGKYAGTTLIGKLGIEASYEKQLHGSDGSRQILVNAAGRSVQRQGKLTPDLQELKPIAGRDVDHQHRPAHAAGRRAGAHRPSRRGGRDRPEQR